MNSDIDVLIVKEDLWMDLKIEMMPSYRIVYMRRTGAYGIENAHLMETFKNWIKTKQLWNEETIILGIAQDDSSFVNANACRYDVCLVVTDHQKIQEKDIKVGNIDGGKYAVFKIIHTSEAVQQAWMNVFQELSEQNYIMDQTRPILERYQSKLVNNHFCEICVPIK